MGLLLALAAAPVVWAQTTPAAEPRPAAAATPPPAGGATALPPAPQTQAVRQRVALVVAIGRVGGRELLPTAGRDAEALVRALERAGYDVIRRDDPGAAALRAAFGELRQRLEPEALGAVFLHAPMAQVDGRNVIVPADAALAETADAAATAALLRVVGVPLQAAVDALGGPSGAPRVLVADGAWRVDPLARLVPPGLAPQRTPPGLVVMLGHAPGALKDLPPTFPPPPGATDPRDIAAGRFTRVLTEALALPGITVTEALRAVRLSVLDGSGGLVQPWLTGNLVARVFLSEPRAPAAAAGASAPAAAATVAAAAGPNAPAPAAAAASAPRPSSPPPAAAAASAAASGAAAASASEVLTVRAPGQGERPVLNARANRLGHAEGDVLSYDRVDMLRDELIDSFVLAIERVAADDTLVADGGRWLLDAEGRTVSRREGDGRGSRFEPAEPWWWHGPRGGESRDIAAVETLTGADGRTRRIAWRGLAQVGSPRVVETPGGDFEVLPIRSTGQGTETQDGQPPRTLAFTRVVYYAPRLALPVAMEIDLKDAAGAVLRRERIELTHAQVARTER